MNREIKKELSELIDNITDLSKKRQTIHKEQQQIRDKINIIRAKLIIDIGTAKDDRGKPVYSNEQLRNAALILRLDENGEYQQLKERLRELNNEDQELVIDYNRLVDRRLLLLVEVGVVNPSSSDNA